MAFSYTEFSTTPTNLTADLKTNILLSADWTNPTASVVKSTTTRGAELVVDLAKSAATAIRLGISAWRVWTGSGPGTGTDESGTRYLTWRNSGGATSDTLYVIVSVSKEHLFISVEGPKAGDTNAISSTAGSATQTMYLGDIVPYHAGDTVPTCAFVCYDQTTLGQSVTYSILVGRDQGGTRSWSPATLATVQAPSTSVNPTLLQHYAKGDSKTYLFPWLVVEHADGLRGRLAEIFSGGWISQAPTATSPGGLSPDFEVTYSSKTYKLVRAWRFPGASSSDSFISPWGLHANGVSAAPNMMLSAVRKA